MPFLESKHLRTVRITCLIFFKTLQILTTIPDVNRIRPHLVEMLTESSACAQPQKAPGRLPVLWLPWHTP